MLTVVDRRTERGEREKKRRRGRKRKRKRREAVKLVKARRE
jgi:hypothetical protein